MRKLRLLDFQDNFVGMIDETEAAALIKSSQASLRASGRRAVLVLKSSRGVNDYRATNAPAGALATIYTEQHAGKTVHVLKRSASDGFTRWDNDLTFHELRAGVTVSAARRIQIALAERARRTDAGVNARKAA